MGEEVISGYLIRVPGAKLAETARWLEKMGIRLDPQEQAMAVRRDGSGRSASGLDLQPILDQINGELEQDGGEGIRPKSVSSRQPGNILKLLEFAASELEWEEGVITWKSWENGSELKQVMERYRAIFPKRTQPEAKSQDAVTGRPPGLPQKEPGGTR